MVAIMVDSFKELGEVLIAIRDEIRGVRALLARIDDKLDKAGAASLVAAPAAARADETKEPAAEKGLAVLPDVSGDFASFAVELQEGAEPASKADPDDFVVSGAEVADEPSAEAGLAHKPEPESEPEPVGRPPVEIDAFPVEPVPRAMDDESKTDVSPASPDAPPTDDDLISLLAQVNPVKPPRARPAASPPTVAEAAPMREEKVSTDKFDLSSAELDEILKG